MPTTTPTAGRLRALAEVRPQHARVLSVFVNLDPSQFGTPPARASQIASLLNDARRRVDDATGLGHEEHEALRADLVRVEERLRAGDLAVDGTRGLAVFACGPADLFEVLRLPEPIEGAVHLDVTAHLQPLAGLGGADRWGVVLCNRRCARIFAGLGACALVETDRIEDSVHSQHQQGGWSQPRYERGIEEEVHDHLRHVNEVLFETHKRRPFDHLLIAAPTETVEELQARLHPYLAERVAGRLSLDVEHAGVDDVRAAAGEVIAAHRVAHEDRTLGRLREGLARDVRAAAGAEAVLAALEQARVEILLLDDTADPDVAEDAIHAALEQSAEVLRLGDRPDLGPHEGIAAVLRF
jgi:peptide chain release factor subunit 1